ncbi:MAG TPA: PAS domain S-box protein [Candidatus Acidoferrum sp.]|nr:PAS domain S-box protein [Candidatus Acidoferrum sp.]
MISLLQKDQQNIRATEHTLLNGMSQIERREWWLWSSAVLVTLLLTLALISFVLTMTHKDEFSWFQVTHSIRGLVALVLLFDIYVIYQQLQIYRIRRQLIQREELFRLITENAADMIAVIDGDGRRLYHSPSYERVLGYNAEEMRQTSSMAHVHPEDRHQVEEAAHWARNTGVGRRIEYRMRHKDGSWRFFESTASPIQDEDGKPGKLVIVNRDITDRRGLEEQFRQSQKMEAVGRLSGGIAHDFNNILGVIIGYGEILQERMDANHPLVGCVEEILGAGRRAASLTRQLLAFSRQQVLEPKVIDLNGIIADTEKMLKRLIGEDVQLITVLDSRLTTVKADRGQIEQVVLNLCVNARDAMPAGGKMTIKTEHTVIDEVEARKYSYPFSPGPYVLLTFTDTGFGMDVATQTHIFEPFFTTKEKGKGTGLGLATVYGVVKQSGGYIEVHSEVRVGTTFKIYLPRVDEPVEPEKDFPATTLSLHGDETVLLVEDEDSLRTLNLNVLNFLGYTVLEARNGEEACQVSAKHEGRIDLVLTDVIMPGMNGPTLAQQLCIWRPELRVLYMSGHTGQGVGHGVLPAGSNFLPKPFTRDHLAHKVREALGTAGRSPR